MKIPESQQGFRPQEHIKRTELSKYVKRYRKGTPYNMNWSIIEKVKSSTKINCCPLYLIEKYHITEHFNGIRLLNKKSEFTNASRYQRKQLLKNFSSSLIFTLQNSEHFVGMKCIQPWNLLCVYRYYIYVCIYIYIHIYIKYLFYTFIFISCIQNMSRKRSFQIPFIFTRIQP